MNAAESVCSPSRFCSRFGRRRAAEKTSACGPTPKYAPRALVRTRPARRLRKIPLATASVPPDLRVPCDSANRTPTGSGTGGVFRQPGGGQRADDDRLRIQACGGRERPAVPEPGVLTILELGVRVGDQVLDV